MTPHPGPRQRRQSAAHTNVFGVTTVADNTPLLRSSSGSLARDNGLLARGRHLQRSGGIRTDAAPIALSGKRGIYLVVSMWLLIFLQASNMSGITTTQGTIAEDLDAYENAMWFTSAYLITVSSLSPLVGRLSTIFHAGTLLLFTSVVFAIGAVVTAVAPSFGAFIIGRVLIGAGGSGILTLTVIMVLQLTDKKRRGLFMGLVNAGFTIGLSTGAVVFGALLPVIGWRALFWVQVPISLLGGLGVYMSLRHTYLHEDIAKDESIYKRLAGIDYAGAFVLTLTIVLFLYGLCGEIKHTPIVLSVFSLVLFIIIEFLIASDPIIPLTILRSRGVLLSCLAQLGFMAARWTVLYFGPVFVLAVRGLPPAIAGAVLLPTNAGFGIGGLLAGFFHIRRAGSFWLPCLLSLFLFGATLLWLSLVSTRDAPVSVYVAAIFFNGLCTGAALNYTLAHMLHLSPPSEHFVATSLLGTFRGFAGSFGTAIGGGIFARSLKDRLADGFRDVDGGRLANGRAELITRLIGSPGLVFKGGLTTAEQTVAIDGYVVAVRILYQAAVFLCVVTLVVQAATGWTAPVNPDEEGIEEAIAEHDGRMEA